MYLLDIGQDSYQEMKTYWTRLLPENWKGRHMRYESNIKFLKPVSTLLTLLTSHFYELSNLLHAPEIKKGYLIILPSALKNIWKKEQAILYVHTMSYIIQIVLRWQLLLYWFQMGNTLTIISNAFGLIRSLIMNIHVNKNWEYRVFFFCFCK